MMITTAIKYLSVFALVVMTTLSYAATEEHFIITRQCMLPGKFQYELIANASDLVFIKTNQFDAFQATRLKKEAPCRGFIDVTQRWQAHKKSPNANLFLQNYLVTTHSGNLLRGYKIQYQVLVNNLAQLIASEQIQRHLNQLAAFHDRNAYSPTGVQAAEWIVTTLQASANNNVQLYRVNTLNEVAQPSIVLKLGKNLSGPGIVLGAHIDTIENADAVNPGADDDASGSVALLEIARVLMNSHLIFKKPIYFIWYAAQEQGELGSQSVVQKFKHDKTRVDAALQLDMTGYIGSHAVGVGLTEDYTDMSLTAFVADLVATYLQLPASAVHCGFACSDHVSWYQNNTPVAYPFETTDDTGNPNVHTRNDKMNKLSMQHMVDFVKLGLAFAVELAEPNSRN